MAQTLAERMTGRLLQVAVIIDMARELCLQLEADKHRDQPELLEVRLLAAIEGFQREDR